MNIIPITLATLDIIEALNGGIRPELEDEAQFYVYKGKDESAEIISSTQMDEQYDEVWFGIVKILYRGDM